MIEELKLIADIEVFEDISLKKYSTLRLQFTGSAIVVRSISALLELLPVLVAKKIPYFPIGWGANVVLPEQLSGVLLKLDLPFDRSLFSTPRTEYTLPASLGLNVMSSHATKFGVKGWELLTGIPASLGGAIFMNAGTKLGEIGELVNRLL